MIERAELPVQRNGTLKGWSIVAAALVTSCHSTRMRFPVQQVQQKAAPFVRDGSTAAVTGTLATSLLHLSNQTLAMRAGMSGSCQERTKCTAANSMPNGWLSQPPQSAALGL